MPTPGKTNSLARIVALAFGGQWMVLQVMVWVWQGLEFAEHFWYGNDFAYLYNAANFYLSGKSPYLESNFIPLPPALYVPMLLHRLSFWSALTAFRTISFLLVVAAILWLCRELRVSALNSALLLIVVITYGPFYSVLAGGNLDALMLAFMVFACARNTALRSAFLGLSIGTKFYSLLLIPVLVLRRRWREVFWALGVLVLLFLPFARYAPGAFSSVFHRTAVLRLDANESPAVLFILLFGEKHVWAWRSCYAVLWGGTLLARLIADYKKDVDLDRERFRALDYLPWMAAAPVLVFTYTGTILLPVLVVLVRRNQDRALNWGERLMVMGIALTGVYPVLYHRVFSYLPAGVSRTAVDHFGMAIAPLGISAILIGSAALAWRERTAEIPDSANTTDAVEPLFGQATSSTL